MNMRKALLAVILWCSLSAVLISSQSKSGIVSGIVRDDSNQPLPKVSIALLDNAGKVVVKARTSEAGLYRLENVPPGSYQLIAELQKVSFGNLWRFSGDLRIGENESISKDLMLIEYMRTKHEKGDSPSKEQSRYSLPEIPAQ